VRSFINITFFNANSNCLFSFYGFISITGIALIMRRYLWFVNYAIRTRWIHWLNHTRSNLSNYINWTRSLTSDTCIWFFWFRPESCAFRTNYIFSNMRIDISTYIKQLNRNVNWLLNWFAFFFSRCLPEWIIKHISKYILVTFFLLNFTSIIIIFAFIFIAQYFIGLTNFLEFNLITSFIWMMFQYKFSICFFNFFSSCIFCYL